MGVYYESTSHNFFSIGKDAKLAVFSLIKKTSIYSTQLGASPLTALQGDKYHKRLFICNKAGSLFIMDTSNVK
jgi:hypothetical protein